MNALAVYGAIRDELRRMPELRKLPWRDHPHPLGGHCYVAVEAFCALVPGAKPKVVRVPVGDTTVTHWYAVRNHLIYDPTVDQFDVPVPYHEGRGCGFLTKEPSKRAQALLSRQGRRPMATKTRRRTRKDAPGKEAWQIVGPDGAVLYEGGQGEGATLIRAHRMAERDFDEPTTLSVRLVPLFGEPDEFFRVVREEDGSVSSYRK